MSSSMCGTNYISCILLCLNLLIIFLVKESSANDFGDLAKMLAQLGGAGECRFKCPMGVKPLANQSHKPSSNGCGSSGLQLDTSNLPGFTDCCDEHDKCYDTCNNDKDQCDDDFQSCLSNVCLMFGLTNKKLNQEMKECQKIADVMYSGTVGFGCGPYKESQRNACLCDGRKLDKEELEEIESGSVKGEL